MPVSFAALAFSAVLAAPSRESAELMQPLPPLTPDTSIAHDAPDVAAIAAQVDAALNPEKSYPARIAIPSVGIDSPVIQVGVNAAGEMDVPDGSTKNVGWYKYGVVPGTAGSAVMDAHVYAAFKRLKSASVGSSIFVTDAGGSVREFRIISSKSYPLAQVPMQAIFNDVSGKYLNLITCEGRYLISKGTYDKRRVVYAELVSP